MSAQKLTLFTGATMNHSEPRSEIATVCMGGCVVGLACAGAELLRRVFAATIGSWEPDTVVEWICTLCRGSEWGAVL